MTFVEREVKRGNKYDALIFDPPGHFCVKRDLCRDKRDLIHVDF
jgi:23S rRNA G2069 N7-methylase RlmK/C1962 C5-methylase RlmI